jgi:cell division protein FtsZ
VNEAAEIIYDLVDPDANLIFGAVVDEAMQDEVSITLIATGVGPKDPAYAQSLHLNQQATTAPPASSASRATSPAAAAAAGQNGNGHAPVRQHMPAEQQQQGAGSRPNVVVERPAAAQPRVRADMPTGGVEIPAFLRRLNKK